MDQGSDLAALQPADFPEGAMPLTYVLIRILKPRPCEPADFPGSHPSGAAGRLLIERAPLRNTGSVKYALRIYTPGD
jgi:hypothetical protein